MCMDMRVNMKEEVMRENEGFFTLLQIFYCWSSKPKPGSLGNSTTVQSLF